MSELEKIKKLMLKHKLTNPLGKDRPFIQVLSRRERERMQKLGFKEIADFEYIVYNNVDNYPLEENFSAEVGHFSNSALLKELVEVGETCFPGINYRKIVPVYIKELVGTSLITLIKNSRGKTVAAGGANIGREGITLLFSGGVLPRYRSQGLWRMMNAARMKYSLELGAKSWFFTTTNDQLKSQGQRQVNVRVFEL